jgi:hypothetical protein
MKSILDPSFRYTTSFNTNLQKTFARIRREQQQETESAAVPTSGARANVSSIVMKTETCAARRLVLAVMPIEESPERLHVGVALHGQPKKLKDRNA